MPLFFRSEDIESTGDDALGSARTIESKVCGKGKVDDIDSKSDEIFHDGGKSWIDMSWLMLSDILGTSVLTFMVVATQLGWVLTCVFINDS